MRFNARQLKAAKEEAVESARRRHRLGGRLRFASGIALGTLVGLCFAYHYPDIVKKYGDQIRAEIKSPG